jgi:NRPS condensation-like uncharacterized protein
MKGRLNIPQRTVLAWNDLHPYNAIHVARIPAQLNPERLNEAIKGHLENYGITGLSIDRGKMRFHYHGGPAHTEFKVIDGDKNSFSLLCTEIQEQLNTPFAQDTTMNPFRFFVIREQGSFYLGLVYYHLISGGDSIIYLLKDIINYYLNRTTSIPHRPLTLYQRSHNLLPFLHPKHLFEWIAGLPGHISEFRKYFRPKYRDFNDHNVGFTYFSIGSSLFLPLLQTTRRWGVSLNDMFIALLLKSLSPLAQKRVLEQRRTKISVVSVINIRRDLSIDSQKSFGMFLGAFDVSHSVPDGIELEGLVKDVHSQTVEIKKHKLYLQTILEEGLAIFLVSHLYKKRKKKFYSKYHPVWGGISNINLNNVWDQTTEDVTVDYFRTVSTGPATPLVFSLTTVRDHLNIGVSFRTTVFSRNDIEKIVSDFTKYITNLNGMVL